MFSHHAGLSRYKEFKIVPTGRSSGSRIDNISKDVPDPFFPFFFIRSKNGFRPEIIQNGSREIFRFFNRKPSGTGENGRYRLAYNTANSLLRIYIRII